MAIYTVRVVLSGAEWDTYEKLHESMQASGYTREVTSDDGVVFKLPDAEYVTTKSIDVYQVRDEVLRIAKTYNFDPQVLVTEAVQWAWALQKA